MTEYVQQLLLDQMVLEKMVEERRASFNQISSTAGDPLQLKGMRPSVRLLHQAYLYILEDALSILKSLIDYFSPPKA